LSNLVLRLPSLRQAAAAAAMIAVGYFAGRFSAGQPVLSSPESVVSSIRSVQRDPSGRVQIAFDETRPRVLAGRMDDDQIRQLLLAAAREQSNAGVRVESVEMLRSQSSLAEVRSTLLEAVAGDPNPGVRLRALEGLKDFSRDSDVRKTLSQVLLRDDNVGVRMEVVDLLITHQDDDVVGVLQNLMEREANDYIRMRTQNALREMHASLGIF
jgi:hypothetical protein